VPELKEKNVQLKTIGVLNDLPLTARRGIKHAIKELKNNTGLIVNLALSYSSRLEIATAVRTIAEKAIRKEISTEEIDEQLLSKHLYTADLPDPDFLIRTSGENRISNFLLWQIAYSELFCDKNIVARFQEKRIL